ncbi:MAG TPA: GTP-binding protein [Pseudonocardia sp.]
MDTELVLVSGLAVAGVGQVVDQLLTVPGTAVLHHDLTDVMSGVVRRRLRLSGPGGVSDRSSILELAHGCASCTLREDVLPLIRELARQPEVRRVVLHLDPVLEPEQVCWAVLHVVVDGAPVALDVRLGGVITVLDQSRFLADAVSSDDLSEHRLAVLPDDERTIAQLAIGQAEFADLLVYSGEPAEQWQRARTTAVLARLTPLAPRIELAQLDAIDPLRAIPAGARRCVPDSPHATLLRGQPPLSADRGVQLMVFTARRPFHPERLHEAMDLLLDGVVRTKGRLWLATRPDAVLWMESAGGGLQIGYVDQWLAAQDDDAWARADAERRTVAALRWHPRFGDRVQEITVLTCGADVSEVADGLRGALLTDAELAAGERTWRGYPDPFGWHHTDPCGQPIPAVPPTAPPLSGGALRGEDEQ